MNENVTAFLRINHAQLTDFGAIMSGNVEQSAIPHLSSHFSVTRRLIEDDIDLIRPISRQQGFHDRLGFQKIVAEKLCRRNFVSRNFASFQTAGESNVAGS